MHYDSSSIVINQSLIISLQSLSWHLNFVQQYQIISQMSEKYRNERRQQNRYNYSIQLNNNDEVTLNLHHKYFKLYEKFSADQSDAFSFYDHKPNDKDVNFRVNSFHDEFDTEKNTVVQLQHQNKLLQSQLKDSEVTINSLKSEYYLCKAQLDQISKSTKIESYGNQDTIRDLTEEIQIILERNRNAEAEIRKLKDIIRDLNESQIKSNCQLNQLRLNSRSRSLGRAPLTENSYEIKRNVKNMKVEAQQKQIDSNQKFITGLKQMYSKIMNYKAVSLKQLWRWLKQICQMFHQLKKWRKNCRNQLKQSKNMSVQRLIDLLNDAMIFIN